MTKRQANPRPGLEAILTSLEHYQQGEAYRDLDEERQKRLDKAIEALQGIFREVTETGDRKTGQKEPK